MMRRSLVRLLPAVAAVLLAAHVAAQESNRPLGDLLDTLPPPEAAPRQPGVAAPEVADEDKPVLPIVRPPPFSAAPPPQPLPPLPTVAPGRVSTMDLPPSTVIYERPAPAETPVVAVEAPPAPIGATTDADANWAALQERRRQEINALEAPVVARLNANVAAEQEAARLRAEQAQADYERDVANREDAIRQTEEEHQAAMAAHDADVARQRTAYEAQVAACLAGDREACMPR